MGYYQERDHGEPTHERDRGRGRDYGDRSQGSDYGRGGDDRRHDRQGYGGNEYGRSLDGGGYGGGYEHGGGGRGRGMDMFQMAPAMKQERALKRARLSEHYVSGVWRRSPSPPGWAKKEAKKDREIGSGKGEKLELSRAKAKQMADAISNSKKKLSKSQRSSENAKSKDENKAKGVGDDVSASGSTSSDESSSDSQHSDAEDEWEEMVPEVETTQAVGDEFVGPLPVEKGAQARMKSGYDKHMLAGEADAMAAYIEEGQRIPRRGEIGLTSDEISNFEKDGYVMSGSRHRRMEAVRLRKENQVYTADERRALAMFNYEEKKKKENQLLSDLREQVNSKLKETQDRSAFD
ncbi:hypothetical protein SARC_04723 [Sphaeroforma arctica JP610]|uniref:NF-kappa-B-activating protein C-terminal domain-containing protein n=1 Tax=Sphaeroforma arctica JP610 TaxID=667725 RepID=A0A0L0G1M9_9EUKA|nr:hypothetical protein SARC_04723 [Sphaeroforma arctica JP610]KNC83000.1 hypothetical protein SARC_04723 [Sphaeroforma arctica JP610]|eukprot:XP_014156902.1 hypothetical protein SARC_04723 [Sphaeroforma arctica JP610]